MRTFSFILALFVAAPLFAANPKIAFHPTQTPLQQAIQKANRENAATKGGKLNAGDAKDKCQRALAEGNDRDLKHCDAADMELTPRGPARTFRDANGKTAGKRLVTETVLRYRKPANKKSAKDTTPAPRSGRR